MQLFKFAVITSLISLLVLPINIVLAHAQSPSITGNRTSLVATVNLENAKIVSQKDNTFKIGFDISNGEGQQTDVRYGLLLTQKGTNYISDQVVYDEALTLSENSKVHREITYTAPSIFGGNYELVLNSSNSSGFPFSVAYVGSVTLSASAKGVLIDPSTCHFQINGDKVGTQYALTKNVDVRPSEALNITCTAQNQTDTSVTVTPAFETRYFSQFGTIAPAANGTIAPIVLAGNEKKTFTLAVPKGTTPDFYSLKLTMSGSASNAVYAQYIVSGVTASVQNLSLDKNQYQPGDIGKLLLIWTSNAGNFERTKTGTASPSPITIKATVTNKTGTACAAPIEQVLVRDQMQPQTSVPFTVTAACSNPQAAVTLLDAKGTVLDQKTFAFTSTASTGPLRQSKTILVIVGILILAGAGFALRKKHMKPSNDTLPN